MPDLVDAIDDMMNMWNGLLWSASWGRFKIQLFTYSFRYEHSLRFPLPVLLFGDWDDRTFSHV